MMNNKTIDNNQPRVYEQFYGFSEPPFYLLPDPEFLYLGEKHRAALDSLELAIINQSGFCVISGDIGVGKTTLVRELLNRLDDSIRVGLVTNTHPSFGELLQMIMAAFGLKCDTGDNFELHKRFTDFIIQQYANQKHTLLIIDEAQHLSVAALEELRMLSNINADKDFLLQIILVGQKNLHDKLIKPELRQFAQRIAVDYHLSALDEKETREYIQYRVNHAGGSADLFSDDTCHAVYRCSEGIPRLINRICGVSLVYGYSEQSRVISPELVRTVARDQRITNIQSTSEGLSQRGADAYKKLVEPENIITSARIGSNNSDQPDAVMEHSSATLHQVAIPASEDGTRSPDENVTGPSGDRSDASADQQPASTLAQAILATGNPQFQQHQDTADALETGRQTAQGNNKPPIPTPHAPAFERQRRRRTPGNRRGATWVLAGMVIVAGVIGWIIRDYQDITPTENNVTVKPSSQLPPAAPRNEEPLQEAERLEAQRRQAELELAGQRAAERLEQQRRQAEQELAEQRAAERLEQQRRQAEQELAEQRAAERLEQQRRQAEQEYADQQLEDRRSAAEAVLNNWSNTPEWSDVSGDKAKKENEARRAAARAAWEKWSNTTGWSEE